MYAHPPLGKTNMKSTMVVDDEERRLHGRYHEGAWERADADLLWWRARIRL